jgi:nitrate/TMAO reductase-like tetraheme cytochrome c subunit
MTSKKGFFLIAVPVVFAVLIGLHELSVRHFQDTTCVVCHEMREPIKNWKESGTSKNHNNCAGCHYDEGLKGWWAMNTSAVTQLLAHLERNPNDPLKPRKEPVFLDVSKEPGYWSHVPNHRCFQCHDAKNHKEIDQPKIHSRLLKDISKQPCKDCHSHEMKNGQKFYEKVLTDPNKATQPGA